MGGPSFPPAQRTGHFMASAQVRRASLALAQALRELELESGPDQGIEPFAMADIEALFSRLVGGQYTCQMMAFCVVTLDVRKGEWC